MLVPRRGLNKTKTHGGGPKSEVGEEVGLFFVVLDSQICVFLFVLFNGKSLKSTQQKEGIYTDFVGSKRFLTGSGLTSGDLLLSKLWCLSWVLIKSYYQPTSV